MSTNIKGRNVEITDEIRAYIEKKLPRIEKYTDRIQSLNIVLKKDGYQHRADMRLKAGPLDITAETCDHDLMKAVDMLVDKIERLLIKKADKLWRGRKHKAGKQQAKLRALQEAESGETREPEPVKSKVSARSKGHRFPLDIEKLDVKIFPPEQVTLARMSLDEAAEVLYFKDENFVCFLGDDNPWIKILYRRKDGHFGLHEIALPAE
ncbi:MAG: ribosome-associated translation inhibitor RaiA [bacterium]|nr:ribosome-associated translation inhibitor RaiA [Candidatus Sumerlaeota bacterium]